MNYFDFEDKNNFVISNILPNYLRFVSQSEIDDLINDGFYSLEFDQFNSKIIALNPFITLKQNIYLTEKNVDIDHFFEKFSHSLYESEKKGQKVIVLSHVPLQNHDNLSEFELCFNIVMQRFHETIQTVISSHIHYTDMRFFRSKTGKPININFVSPALTTMANHNP